MPTPTYTPLASTTLAAAVTEITFAVPSGYKDLILVATGSVSAGQGVYVYFNNDTTASNYSRGVIYGDGSSPAGGSAGDAKFIDMYVTQNTVIIQVMDYSATDKNKTVITRSNAANGITEATFARWANNNAINSIKLQTTTGTFSIGLSMSLYGIVA